MSKVLGAVYLYFEFDNLIDWSLVDKVIIIRVWSEFWFINLES